MVTNLVDSTELENKNLSPSKDFFNLVEEFAQSFDKPKEIYKKIVDLGRNEGFKDTEIDLLVGSYLKGRVHRNTLANYKKEFLKIPELHKNVHIDDKKVIEESSIIEEIEPIKPRDIGEISKDDWIPPKELIPKYVQEEKLKENNGFKQFREEKAIKELKIIMSKNIALKFANELRLDIFRLPKDGNIEFIMNDEGLTYELN